MWTGIHVKSLPAVNVMFWGISFGWHFRGCWDFEGIISVLGLDESKHTFQLPVQSRAKVSFVIWSSDDVVTIVVRILRWSVHECQQNKRGDDQA